MINLDINNMPQALRVFLCKPDNTVICELNGIEPENASIKINLNNQNELEFDYYRYIDNDGGLIEANGYDSLLVGMRLLVENIGYFRLKYPPYTDDGDKETKHITAYSLENELEEKDLVSFKINTGEESSMENLVVYENGETEELLNPYTGLPYDYIVFYNTFSEQLLTLKNKYSDGTVTNTEDVAELVEYCKLIPRITRKINKVNDEITVTEYVKFNYDVTGKEVVSVELTNITTRLNQLITFYNKYGSQLSLLDLAIKNSGCQWTVGEVDESMANKRFQFDIDGQNIYSFLTQDVAQQSKCLAWFDTINRTINYKATDDFGEDSGVIIDKDALLNNVDVNVSEDKITTRFNVSGGEDLNLLDVNFADNRIVNIDYYLNAKNSSGERLYINDSLASKYKQYESDVETARQTYISYARTARQYEKEIDEIKHRVPNDVVKTEWENFTSEELDAALTQYTELLATLESLYKEDYPNGFENGQIIENVIKQTIYWHDYFAYNEAITQINAAILAIQNNITYNLISSDDTLINGSGNSVNVTELINDINAWETEWSLYGTIELQNKIKAYNDKISVLIDNKSIFINNAGSAIAWQNLTDEQRAKFNGDSGSYGDNKELYDKLYTERSFCQTYLDSLKSSIDSIQTSHDSVIGVMNQIKILVTLSGYSRFALHELVPDVDISEQETDITFTPPEIKLITGFYSDKNYSNSNILKTSIDDIVSVIDIEKELLDDAKEALSIESQPQFTFTASIDNVLIMPEFQGYKFNVGNFVYLQYYDDYYVQLRLDSLQFNPFAPENSLNVTFTNYTTSNAKRSDLSYILKNNSTSGGGSSSGGSGSGSGDEGFGNSSKIDITISNTMLSKLLNTEMFATRVSNVILDTMKLNILNSRYATFGSLAAGETTIDGACIQTGVIKSDNYDGTVTDITDGTEVVGHSYALDNTHGSIINLNNGYFNFAGGKLVYEVNNNIPVLKLKGSFEAGSDSQTKINADGTLSFGGGKLTYVNGTLSVNGAITATTLSTGLKTSSATGANGANGLFIDSDGNLYAGSNNDVKIFADGTFNFAGGKLVYEVNNNIPVLKLKGSFEAGSDSQTKINADGTLSFGSGNLTYDGITLKIGNFGISDIGGLRYYTDEHMFSLLSGAEGQSMNSNQSVSSSLIAYSKKGDNNVYYRLFSLTYNGGVECRNLTVGSPVGGGSLRATKAGNFGISGLPYADTWILRYNADNDLMALYDGKIHIQYYDPYGTGASYHYLRPTTTNNIFLGTNLYRWHSVYCSDGAFNGSDRKIKNHIEYLSEDENLTDFILGLKPIMYTLKSGEGHRHHMGFYAQDVSETAQDTIGDIAAYQATVLSENEDGEIEESYYDENVSDDNLSWVLNYSELIAPTVAVLQKALLKIQNLENEIRELKGE